jgi:ADP-heptose:LPS heptosyltransferase
VRFYGLQMGGGRADLDRVQAPESFADLGSELADFSDTAAAMAALDLILTPCTSTAHLAGALGRPVWVILGADPDWRWLLDRDTSPWYPTARLFRRPRGGDWSAPVARMKAELERMAGPARA